MKLTFTALLALLPACFPAFAGNETVVETTAYSWKGDTLYQGPFKAWAANPYEIRSTYHGRPGYSMPVDQVWKRKNDLSGYPRLSGGNPLLEAVYNMGLDEMVNAVEPDNTLRTGKEWAGVWTRDVSYSIILSMAALQPEAAMTSLLRKVNAEGQIIQDTGSGGAWPISTDRMVWVLAVWEVYKVTGDRKWLEKVYPVAVRSFDKDKKTVVDERGLVKGETSFIDWREQSYPKWMQTVDISQSEALGTNAMYAAALRAISEMATVLGKKKEAVRFKIESAAVASAIDEHLWLDGKGHHAMYTYGRGSMISNPRSETLGEALGILYDITPREKFSAISQSMPQTPFGAPVFYPQIPDMPSYHNNALWPFVASYWTLAQAKAGNEQGVLEGFGSIVRPAALFATNKENLNVDNGDFFTELNSSNMLWSLSGNLALTNRILFGIEFDKNGLRIEPFVPEAFAGKRTLSDFPYRGAKLNITVEGFGDKVEKLCINGKTVYPGKGKVIPAKLLKGNVDILVEMNNEPIAPMALNRVGNARSPLTPTAWLSADPSLDAPGVPDFNVLEWNPIEYIAGYVVYRDGKEVGRTRQTSWPALLPGEWQVVGISTDGIAGFASEPRSNRQFRFHDMENEKKSLDSGEVAYRPESPVEGFKGQGFAETDRSVPVYAMFETDSPGEYLLSFRYANGNGPVNTENKAAVRSLYVDGVEVATVVLPQRGVANWNDWGMSNQVKVSLEPGIHRLMLKMNPEDENMNLQTNHALVDGVRIETLK